MALLVWRTSFHLASVLLQMDDEASISCGREFLEFAICAGYPQALAAAEDAGISRDTVKCAASPETPDTQEFELKLAPPPIVALFSQNPHVMVACAPAVVLGLTGELIGSVQRALKIGDPTSLLTDTFVHRVENLTFPIHFPPYEIEVPGADATLRLVPEMTPNVIRFVKR